jgi:hypothetical protein
MLDLEQVYQPKLLLSIFEKQNSLICKAELAKGMSRKSENRCFSAKRVQAAFTRSFSCHCLVIIIKT